MDRSPDKEQLLRSAGFRYHFDRMAYVNRQTKKVFSVERVHGSSEEQLRELIDETNDSGDWCFYFVHTPTQGVREAFLAQLG